MKGLILSGFVNVNITFIWVFKHLNVIIEKQDLKYFNNGVFVDILHLYLQLN